MRTSTDRHGVRSSAGARISCSTLGVPARGSWSAPIVHPRRHAVSITNDLERLAELHCSGALSDAEFASAKARALTATPHAFVPEAES